MLLYSSQKFHRNTEAPQVALNCVIDNLIYSSQQSSDLDPIRKLSASEHSSVPGCRWKKKSIQIGLKVANNTVSKQRQKNLQRLVCIPVGGEGC